MDRQKILRYILLIFSWLLVQYSALAQDSDSKPRTRGIQYVAENDPGNKKEQIRLFQGMAVSFDAAGAVMYAMSNYGQLEGQLRINLKETFFPVFELGMGHSNHTDEETLLHYHVHAPYMRIGCDYNICKQKTTGNRIYAGLRYGYTSFKYDLSGNTVTDPLWDTSVPISFHNQSSSMSWMELVFGLEAKIYKTFHVGWSMRYRKHLSSTSPALGNAWYVPGFGTYGGHNFGGTFNLIFDI